jgi:hypothetical protein
MKLIRTPILEQWLFRRVKIIRWVLIFLRPFTSNIVISRVRKFFLSNERILLSHLVIFFYLYFFFQYSSSFAFWRRRICQLNEFILEASISIMKSDSFASRNCRRWHWSVRCNPPLQNHRLFRMEFWKKNSVLLMTISFVYSTLLDEMSIWYEMLWKEH